MPRGKKVANTKKKGGPDENQANAIYLEKKRKANEDKLAKEKRAHAAKEAEAARLKAIEDSKPSGIRPTMPNLKPASWFCHNCSVRNASNDRFCSMCGRHETWVAPRPMSERPLHTEIAECIRFPQFEVMLDAELKREKLRSTLLLNAGFDKAQIDAPGADGDKEARVREQVSNLIVAADIANANVKQLPPGMRAVVGGGGSDAMSVASVASGGSASTAGGFDDATVLDSVSVVSALTGVTGEDVHQRMARKRAERAKARASLAAKMAAAQSNPKAKRGLYSASGVSDYGKQFGLPTPNLHGSTTDDGSIGGFDANDSSKSSSRGSTPAKQVRHQGSKSSDHLANRVDRAVNDYDDHGWAPLHVASRSGSSELVFKLIENGALVQAKTRHGWRAIHIACQFAHPLVVRMLLSQDTCRVDWKTDGEKQLPIHLAAGADADPDAVDEVLQLLATAGADVNARNHHGRTALHVAAERRKRRACAKLLELGADLEARDREEWTPRQLAEFLGHTECEDVMIDSLCSETQLREDLPAPKWRSTYWSDATADRGAAQLRTLRADFKRETYRLNERYMEEYFHDVDFHAHIRKHGPGQTPFDYDHYRTTFKGVDMHHERLKEREERAAKLKEKNLAMKMAAAAFGDMHYSGAALGYDASTENSHKRSLRSLGAGASGSAAASRATSRASRGGGGGGGGSSQQEEAQALVITTHDDNALVGIGSPGSARSMRSTPSRNSQQSSLLLPPSTTYSTGSSPLKEKQPARVRLKMPYNPHELAPAQVFSMNGQRRAASRRQRRREYLSSREGIRASAGGSRDGSLSNKLGMSPL